MTLEDFRGKVVAVAFIYTWCPDVCPMLTDKMARVQDELGPAFGTDIAFVSISVDPERDTPKVLKDYAEAFDANLAGWSFLTGEPAAIRDVAHGYGVAVREAADGQVDHTLLTTLVDRQRHDARAVSRLSVRSGGVPPRPPRPRERALIAPAEPRGRPGLARAGARPDQAAGRVSRDGGAAHPAGRGRLARAQRDERADRGADRAAAQDHGLSAGAARYHPPAVRRFRSPVVPGRAGAGRDPAPAQPVRLRPRPAAARGAGRGRSAGRGQAGLRPFHRRS